MNKMYSIAIMMVSLISISAFGSGAYASRVPLKSVQASGESSGTTFEMMRAQQRTADAARRAAGAGAGVPVSPAARASVFSSARDPKRDPVDAIMQQGFSISDVMKAITDRGAVGYVGAGAVVGAGCSLAVQTVTPGILTSATVGAALGGVAYWKRHQIAMWWSLIRESFAKGEAEKVKEKIKIILPHIVKPSTTAEELNTLVGLLNAIEAQNGEDSEQTLAVLQSLIVHVNGTDAVPAAAAQRPDADVSEEGKEERLGGSISAGGGREEF